VVHLFERLLHEDEGDQGGKVFLREPENLNKNMNYLNWWSLFFLKPTTLYPGGIRSHDS
jgi:hypothetical protein